MKTHATHNELPKLDDEKLLKTTAVTAETFCTTGHIVRNERHLINSTEYSLHSYW